MLLPRSHAPGFFRIFLFAAILALAESVSAQNNFALNTTIDISKFGGSETDPAVAVNPNNSSNIFAAAVSSVTNGLFTAWSANVTAWTTGVIAGNGTNLSPATGSSNLVPAYTYGEPACAWDVNSNLFVAYIPSNFQGIAVAVSTNGGQSFVALTNLYTNDVNDQPRIVAAQGTTAAGSNCADVCIVYKDYSLITNGQTAPLVVQWLQTTNVGTNGIGAFSPQLVIPSSSSGGFPDIAIGPSNQVIVGYQNNLVSSSQSSIYVNVNTNILSNAFNARITVANDAIGGTTYIPAAPYGDGINAAVGLAWDQNPASAFYGRVYIDYTAISNQPSTNICLRYSVNNGTTWSAEHIVNDDTGFAAQNSHFLPRMGLDPVTGSLAIVWCDCRNDTAALGTNIVQIPQSTNYFTNIFDYDGIQNDDYVPYLTSSTNGGLSVLPNIPLYNTNVTAAAQSNGFSIFCSETSRAANANGVGHCLGIGYCSGNVYPVWPDNSGMIGNAGLPGFDLATGYSVLSTTRLGITVTESPYPPTSDEALNYVVTVTNYGPFAANSLAITNQLGPNIAISGLPHPGTGGTYNISTNGQTLVFYYPSLAVGTSISSRFTLTETQFGFVTNIATVYNTVPFALAANVFTNYATNSTWISSAANAVVTNVVPVNGENLVVGITASPTNADFGSPVLFTMTVTNLGPAQNGSVYLTNFLSANLTQVTNVVQSQGTYSIAGTNLIFALGTIASGQGAAISYSAIPMSINNSTNATNTVVAACSDFDPNLTNTASVVVGLLGEDLGVGIVASAGNINLSNAVSYTVSVTNFGASTNGVVSVTNFFTDNLTAITITQYPPYTNYIGGGQTSNSLYFMLGELSANEVVSFSFTAEAKSVSATDTNAIVSVIVASQDYDPNTNNNFAFALTTLNGEDLAVGGTVSPPNAPVGEPVTYQITVTNLGLSTSGVISLTNLLSPNLSNITPIQYESPPSIAGNRIVFPLNPLGAGQTATVVFTATAASIGQATNLISVGSTDFDTNLVNNTNILVNNIIATPPVITNFAVFAYADSAFIAWNTAYNATVQVAYWTTNGPTNYSPVLGPATNHVVLLTGLAHDTNYYFSAMTWEQETPYLNTPYVTNESFATADNIILNTIDANYLGGPWPQGSPEIGGYYGSYYNVAQTTQNNWSASAAYVPNLPTPGYYNVYTWYPQSPTFSTRAQMYVTSASNAVVVPVNQTTNGGYWTLLEGYTYFGAGTNGNVTIYNNTGESNRFVAANAMKWTYVNSQESGSGVTPAWWSAFMANTIYFSNNPAPFSTNYTAYTWGLLPDSGSLSPAFWTGPIVSNQATVYFEPYQGGRSYSLQSATNLSKPAWVTLTNAPTLITNTDVGYFTVASTNLNSFLRLSGHLNAQ